MSPQQIMTKRRKVKKRKKKRKITHQHQSDETYIDELDSSEGLMNIIEKKENQHELDQKQEKQINDIQSNTENHLEGTAEKVNENDAEVENQSEFDTKPRFPRNCNTSR